MKLSFLYKVGFLLLFVVFGLSYATLGKTTDNSVDSTEQKVSTRYGEKVKIIKVYNKNTGRLMSKEKIKKGKRIYFIEYNNQGKIHRSINRKGKETMHKRGCNC